METLGQYLRHLRENNRISLRQAAARARITAPYLSDIELGRRHPSERVLADLAKVLRTSVDELRRHDPRALLRDIRQRIEDDAGYAQALRRLLTRCTTSEELVRILDG